VRAQTPSQTIGPFFHVAIQVPAPVAVGVGNGALLQGRVLDGEGIGVGDALVEIWDGCGFGRCPTDGDGWFSFVLAAPASPSTDAAPYVAVSVFARGLLGRLMTRCYRPANPAALAADALLQTLPPDRLATLVATTDGDALRFDIHLQGEHETVFLVV
jgi:protocatechuate 3,4-dioxygenase, alpha subunit